MILVPLRDRGSRYPLYCVPAAARSVLSIHAISAEFEGMQSIFGLQPLGMDDDGYAETTVQEMAKTYVTAIQEHQPEGPYFLSGHCFGGLVALEMARIFTSLDEEVALLALLNTTVPFKAFRRMMTQCNPSGRTRLVFRYPVHALLEAIERRRICAEVESSYTEVPQPIADRLRKVHAAHRNALIEYELNAVEVPIVWIRVDSPANRLKLSWEPFTKSTFRCVEAPGDRVSMFEPPNVAVLSNTIAASLPKE